MFSLSLLNVGVYVVLQNGVRTANGKSNVGLPTKGGGASFWTATMTMTAAAAAATATAASPAPA